MFCLDDTAKTILLLCIPLNKKGKYSPLSLSEYNVLASQLYAYKKAPCDLLNSTELARQIAYKNNINEDRLLWLLSNGTQLAFALDSWYSKGIWVITRSHPEYPARFKQHLKEKAPAVLFGAGNPKLLNCGGLAFVGSRNADEEALRFTGDIASLAVKHKMTVISGGAKGVDQKSLLAALQVYGNAIGVLSDQLLKKSVSSEYRPYIASGKLLLISSYTPESPFSVISAMARNKLIYALADYALVVQSEYGKGGTWAGATEECRKEKHRTVFVRITGKISEGNKRLLDKGARPWPVVSENDNLPELLKQLSNNKHDESDRYEKKELPSTLESISQEKRVCNNSGKRKTKSEQLKLC